MIEDNDMPGYQAEWSRRYKNNIEQSRHAMNRAARMLMILDRLPYVSDSMDVEPITAEEHFDDLRYAAYALSTTLVMLQPQSIDRRIDARSLRRGVVRQLLQELILALAVGDIADAFDYGEQIKQAVYEYRLAHEAVVANEREYMDIAGSDLGDDND